MACARCDFYTPKASTRGQLLEAKDNPQRMLGLQDRVSNGCATKTGEGDVAGADDAVGDPK